MVFNDYVKTLVDERKVLVDKLSLATKTHKSVVYRWLSGKVTPPPIKRDIIAKIVGIPAAELFPQNDKEC